MKFLVDDLILVPLKIKECKEAFIEMIDAVVLVKIEEFNHQEANYIADLVTRIKKKYALILDD